MPDASDDPGTTLERLKCPHGFNGTLGQLVRALRVHPGRESLSSRYVKDAAAWLIERQDAELTFWRDGLSAIEVSDNMKLWDLQHS